MSPNSARFWVVASLFVFLFGVRFAVQGSASRLTATFDVVSVRENTGSDGSIRSEQQPPDGFRRANLPLASYLTYAFAIRQRSRVDGIPEWAQSTRYDIVAKATRPITEPERQLMVRDVLATRFGLRSHVESREQTVYVMTALRPDKRLGPGVKPRADCAITSCTSGGTGRMDSLSMSATTLANFAEGMLSNLRGEVVRDETGIEGVFDVTMTWRPDSAADDPNDARPSFFTAIQEQLGLKLEPQRRRVDVLVIDQLERPSPD